jgi:hypothetical protein
MSNSKVRRQLEAQEAKGKLLEGYKKSSNFILNYQVCKAYYKDSALSIMAIVEKILKAKYNLPWQEKIIRKVLFDLRGKTNPLVVIPQFKFEKNTHDIIAEFVYKNFDKMILDKKTNGLYPFELSELMEKYS